MGRNLRGVDAAVTRPFGRRRLFIPSAHRSRDVNRIIWLVGLVVIVLFIAGYFGLR
jgi:hypothetical protein